MVILLKTLSFAIWLIIMIALIIGNHKLSSAPYKKTGLILKETDAREQQSNL
ncbi:MAG TPA: hypothetical protein VFC73_02885 [Syntrophomonadaceae bacterium]|nr:hypothetical protein [Syntrophomonadaceae bacterium]